MSHCPSQDWDRYCQDNEFPETCVCGKETWDEENDDWRYQDAPQGYCSIECFEKHQKVMQEGADAEAEWIKELENENKRGWL